MKQEINKVHHSTRMVQAKHALSVKKAVVVESSQTGNSNVVWLEMNTDTEITHVRQLLLSSKKSIPEDTCSQPCNSHELFKHPKPHYLEPPTPTLPVQ